MKKLKKILALALGASISLGTALGFVGCGTTEKDPVKDPNTDITTPITPTDPEKPVDPVTPVDPDDGKEEEAKKQLEAAVKKANEKLTSLATGKNFTYDLKLKDESANALAYIDVNTAKIEQYGKTTYYTTEESVNYEISQKDNQWHKDLTDTVVAEMLDDFVGPLTEETTWKSFDKESNRLFGTREGDDVILQVESDSIIFAVNYVSDTNYECAATITNIGTTKVTLPENVIDDTKPVEENKLYDAQGNLNYALFADIIKNWMNDGYYLNKISIYNAAELKTIDYISMDKSNNSFYFGAYVLIDGEREGYQNFKCSSNDLYSAVIKGTYKNADDFAAYLKSLTGKPIVADGKVSFYDTTISYENLYTMGKNILTRLQEVGYQGDSIKNAGIKVDEYAGATILDVRKDKDGGGSAMADMGVCSFSNVYIVVQNEDKNLQLLTFNLVYNSKEAIINDSKNNWIISSMDSQEIDYCSYADKGATAQYAFVLDDEAYLIK